jgi:hypothetical protein
MPVCCRQFPGHFQDLGVGFLHFLGIGTLERFRAGRPSDLFLGDRRLSVLFLPPLSPGVHVAAEVFACQPHQGNLCPESRIAIVVTSKAQAELPSKLLRNGTSIYPF